MNKVVGQRERVEVKKLPIRRFGLCMGEQSAII